MRRHLRSISLMVLALLMVALALPSVRPAHASTTWFVNSFTDSSNASCDNSGNQLCSLRDMIGLAVAGDSINFVGFTSAIPLNLNSPLPTLDKPLTIDAQGQVVRIDGQGKYSIFAVSGTGNTINLNGLTLQNGNANINLNSGGALYITGSPIVNVNGGTFTNNVANNNATLGGGAIEVNGTGARLNVNNSTFSGNSVTGSSISGGAIDDENVATVNIANSTFINNSVIRTSGFVGGGALFAAFGGSLNVANSTFFNNSASNGNGGAIDLDNGAVSLNITNSTFVGNNSNGNSIVSNGNTAPTDVRNSIFSSDSFCFLRGALGANNLASNSTCGPTLGAVTNLAGSLANNGGSTQTFALLPGSNAIDGVPIGQCFYPGGFPSLAMFNGGAYNGIQTDQRGSTRASGATGPRCDIGAYEVQSGAPASLTISGFPGSVTAGDSHSVQVTAHDAAGYTAYGYAGTVHFASSDNGSATTLPTNYAFLGGDYGSRSFNVVLTKTGSQSISTTDTANGSLTATQSGIQVNPATPNQIIFIQQPTTTLINTPITPAITAAEEDTFGNVETADNTTQLSIVLASNPGTSTLTGTNTVTVASGVATFSGLSLNKPGVGYKFLIYSGTTPLTAAISTVFTINAPIATATSTPTSTATPTSTPTSTPSMTPTPGRLDTIGIFRPSANAFYLRLHNTTGGADISVAFNPAAKAVPVVGDWTGAGFDTIGVYDQTNGNFLLRNSNTAGSADEQFTFGNPNDTPLSGRWMSSATYAGIGIFRSSNGILYVRNALTTGFSDHAMVLGNPGDQGLAGDWTGRGYDGLGVFRPGGNIFYLVNQAGDGIINSDIAFMYGSSTDLAIAGDWIGQGHDGVGVFRPATGNVYLKNTLTAGSPDNAFPYGSAGDAPIAGHWQLVYPPIAPAPILIPKTAAPQSTATGASAPGGNQIGG